MAKVNYLQPFSLKIDGISFEDLRHCQLRWKLAREARLPEGFYKVRLYLVLHGRNNACRGKRSCVGESLQQELQTEEMVTVGMGDVDGCEIFASLGEPLCQLL